MAGFTVVTDLDAETVLKLVRRVGKELEFTVNRPDEFDLELQKGSLAASIFLGAFIAYCDFRVSLTEKSDGKIKITLERNCPWWTGLIGVNRVKSKAKQLIDEIEEAIQDKGGEVFSRKEF